MASICACASCKKLRDEEKYDGLPALQAAIARDARQAREFFLNHG